MACIHPGIVNTRYGDEGKDDGTYAKPTTDELRMMDGKGDLDLKVIETAVENSTDIRQTKRRRKLNVTDTQRRKEFKEEFDAGDKWKSTSP
jgi:hypothetical protein